MTVTGPVVSPVLPAAHFGHGVALFDLDRTLVPGSSLVVLGRELLRRGLVPRATVARHALTAARFRRRGAGDQEVARVRAGLLAALAGRERDPLLEVLHEVADRVVDLVFPSARWLVERHAAQGDFCVVLTAAPQELAEAVAAGLGLHRAVGTQLEVADGRFTGRLDGPFCYGAGKLERLGRELGSFDLELATAYGDSASDLPVLEGCGTAVAVNPDRRLLAAARRSGWPVLRFE